MEARGFGFTWIRTFILLGVIILLPFSLGIGIAFGSWVGAVVAFGCGALMTAALALRAALIIRVDEIRVDFPDRESFIRAVNETLPSVGYRHLSGEADLLMSKPAGMGFLAPEISLAIHGESATFSGPRERVRRLVRYLAE